jgi:DNA repair protein RecN (Recombination protein N)
MLRFLSVRHLAVIDRLETDFDPGLNVITGETGAGKTMIVAAIDLLAGGRASADLVRTGEDLATVQAIFERSDGRDVIVRREISAQGRSRAFIDDTLATTAALRELASTLVDLHGQHEHQALLDPAEHLDVLDGVAELSEDRDRVARGFEEWRAASSALERTQLSDREKRARIELASFQLQEIERVAPREGEDDTLAAERRVLANADKLSRLSSEAYGALYDDESAALPRLASVWKRVDDLAALDPRFAPYVEMREDVKSKLEDLAYFLRSYVNDLDASPARLQTVEDRLAALERLKKKHGPTLADVLAHQQSLRDELASLDASEEHIATLQRRERECADAFLRDAHALSSARRRAAPPLSRRLETALGDLAMPKCRVEMRITTDADNRERWTPRGIDAAELFLSPNPGEEVRPLARIASGGELSRVMLALRTLAVRDEPGRTLIFDEVDAGIGGSAADAVGARLQGLSDRYQVLCITHLPQIAARASTHFQIDKQIRQGRTVTTLSKLDDSGREGEIGRMIAGAAVSPQVLASARELLRTRRPHEQIAKGESEGATGKGARGQGARGQGARGNARGA